MRGTTFVCCSWAEFLRVRVDQMMSLDDAFTHEEITVYLWAVIRGNKEMIVELWTCFFQQGSNLLDSR